jgi:hypothetical protein
MSSSFLAPPFSKTQRHLKAILHEPRLLVKGQLVFTAVQDDFAAANILRDRIQGLNQSLPETFTLVLLEDGDIFKMANHAEIPYPVLYISWCERTPQ